MTSGPLLVPDGSETTVGGGAKREKRKRLIRTRRKTGTWVAENISSAFDKK